MQFKLNYNFKLSRLDSSPQLIHKSWGSEYNHNLLYLLLIYVIYVVFMAEHGYNLTN